MAYDSGCLRKAAAVNKDTPIVSSKEKCPFFAKRGVKAGWFFKTSNNVFVAITSIKIIHRVIKVMFQVMDNGFNCFLNRVLR